MLLLKSRNSHHIRSTIAAILSWWGQTNMAAMVPPHVHMETGLDPLKVTVLCIALLWKAWGGCFKKIINHLLENIWKNSHPPHTRGLNFLWTERELFVTYSNEVFCINHKWGRCHTATITSCPFGSVIMNAAAISQHLKICGYALHWSLERWRYKTSAG